ncbi:MAG: serine/threonine protein phosphatase, partial [Clostridia bacterium]|nr:serine/threonine protein phosphatase [Clostridia bacterium]
DRELIRLELALEAAAKFEKPIIAMLHYPPLSDPAHGAGFSELLARYTVPYCVYGHIHGHKTAAFEGEYQGTLFFNTSVDRIDFRPLLIAESVL